MCKYQTSIGVWGMGGGEQGDVVGIWDRGEVEARVSNVGFSICECANESKLRTEQVTKTCPPAWKHHAQSQHDTKVRQGSKIQS